MAMYLARARKNGRCGRCMGDYHKAEIIGVFDLRTENGRVVLREHVGCWLDTAMESLKEPVDATTVERERALNYWYQLKYREQVVRKKYTGGKLEKSLARITDRRKQCMTRIAKLGGAPQHWQV